MSKTTASSVGLSWRDALAYIPVQVAGCVLGAITANGMFALAAVSISTHHRATPAHLFSEVIATAGLLLGHRRSLREEASRLAGNAVDRRELAGLAADLDGPMLAWPEE